MAGAMPPGGGGDEASPIGRRAELAVVTRVLDAVPAGPVALILGDEAGIGKSTLWQEALFQARDKPNKPNKPASFKTRGKK